MITKVKDLVLGQETTIIGEITKKPMTKNDGTNEPWIHLKIKDNSGSAYAKIWVNLELYPVFNETEDGQRIEADIICTKVGEYIHVEVKSFKKLPPKVTGMVVDIEALKGELRAIISDTKDPYLKKLLCAVFARPDMIEAYFTAPATMTSGYSFVGGVVASAVRLVRLVKSVAPVFNDWNHNVDTTDSKLNIDLLVTASILEPVGKVLAFRMNGKKVEKTAVGEMTNESYLTLKIVNEELQKLEGFPESKALMLEHLLGSCHGRSDWGALFTTRSREAYAFQMAWNMNLQMGHFEDLDRNANPSDQYVKMFGKTVSLEMYGS